MTRATDIFVESADARVKEVKSWLKSKGVREFEPVSLFSDQLTKETVQEIEEYANGVNKNRSTTAIKKAVVKNIPRHAVLKPAHAIYRLQNQRFALGDRVTMVQDSGGVPLSAKGVVIGLNSKSMDVIWDVAFMAGTTLSDRYLDKNLASNRLLTEFSSRCSPYRGSSVQFSSCLNLSNPQFIASTHPKSAPPPRLNAPFKPRSGPYPAIQPASGQPAAAGFRPAQRHVLIDIVCEVGRDAYYRRRQPPAPIAIMTNPNRGRGAGFPNGPKPRPRGSYAAVGGPSASAGPSETPAPNHGSGEYGNRGESFHERGPGRGPPNGHAAGVPNPEQSQRDASGSGTHDQDREASGASHRHYSSTVHSGPYGQRGFPPGGFNNARGRGFDRGGRGRGYRGRGRGGPHPHLPVPSP